MGRSRSVPDDSVDELARVDAIRRRVLNVIGHELRTPVSTIRGLAEVAAGADDERVRHEIVPPLLRNARRVEELLNEMLVASGIDTALPVGEPVAVPVAEVAEEVWAALPSRRGGSGDRTLRVEGEVSALVTPRALRMLLERVLDNAAKYASGTPVLTVDGDGRVRVVVDAPGPPMHPEEVELATEAFFRGEHAVMTAPGLGLGLAVAKALAEQARGALWVEGRSGGGLRTVLDLEAAP